MSQSEQFTEEAQGGRDLIPASARERATTALLSTPTREEAERGAQLLIAVLPNWERNEGTKSQQCRARARAKRRDSTMQWLSSAEKAAVQTLETIMRDPIAKHSDRIHAAKLLLDQAFAYAQMDESVEQMERYSGLLDLLQDYLRAERAK